MKKKELSHRGLVQLRDGSICEVRMFPEGDGGILVDTKDLSWLALRDYTENLEYYNESSKDPEYDRKYDIVEVYDPSVGVTKPLWTRYKWLVESSN